MSAEATFACCSHCDCPADLRDGHYEACEFGCNATDADLEARAALDLNERRQTTIRTLAALDEPDRLTVLDQIAWDNPDAVTDALNETGHRHE